MSLSKHRFSVDSLKINFSRNNNDIKKKILTPQKSIPLFKSAQLKKLKILLSLNDAKILEIKRNKAQHLSTFHLVGESDKYKLIQKSIQNKILNISMKIIKNCKFDPDLNEFKKMQSKSNKRSSKTLGNLTPKVTENISIKKSRKKNTKSLRHSAKLTQLKEILNERNRRIKRIANLYDSFGEDETDKEKEQEYYGLNPRSIFIDVYDILLLISSFFCLLYMPYILAKRKMVINSDQYFVMFMISYSEIIFIIDLIFGFFRWFYNSEFRLVSNKYMIIENYFCGDFIFDLIMAIPFYTLLKNRIDNSEIYDSKYNEQFYLLKILVCFKAFKIFKLNKIKNNRVTYFFNTTFTKNYYLESIYQIANFFIIICSMFNLIICIHIYMAELSYPNWIVSFNLENKSFLDIYLASFYFIIATMTSVGYGDIVCISKEETFFQIILLSIGLVAYSFIISTVGDYVKNKSRAKMNFNRDMTKLEEIRIAYPNMPFKLYNKIQQHIQRMLHQNKKFEHNILINSLPYTLRNSVLFEIHKNEIDKFTIFKGCDNSDFILKVLTHFIPITSKKNIVLVGEGEFYENIFFIKDGRLTLEAIIDLDNMEMSIEKYLKYRFEEIEKIEDFSDGEDDFKKTRINDKKSLVFNEQKSNKLLGIINQQFENVENISYMHESNIEEEIGQIDFNMENKDFYKGNIEYIHILDLIKYEYFGGILMFLNIPNPLSLIVKSKRAELYVLRKKDAFNIKRDYQNIWKRLQRKSIHNIKSLKSLTLDIINRYCEMNGFIVKGKEIVKTKINKNFKTTFGNINKNKKNNIFNNKENKENKIESKPKPKNTSNTQLNLGNIKLTTLKSSLKPMNINEFRRKNKNEKLKFKVEDGDKELKNNENMDKKETKQEIKSVNNDKERKISKSSSSSSLSFTLTEKTLNKKLNKQPSSEQNLIKYNFKNNIFQKPRNTKKSLKNFQNKIGTNFFGNLPKFSSAESLQNNLVNIAKNSNKNNFFVVTGISSIKEINSMNSNTNLNYSLTRESTISLQISSSYKNINEVTKGQYINNQNFQNLMQKIAKYYIKRNSKKKYSENFNYYEYFKDKIRKDEFDSNFIKQSDKNKNNIGAKNIQNTDKNKNSVSDKIEEKCSKSSKDKSFSLKEIQNIFKNNKLNKNIIPLSKDKYLFDPGENKSVNNSNQLNVNNEKKNYKIFSECNNNASNVQLNKNDENYRHVQTFQKIKNEIENKPKTKKKLKKGKSIENKNLYPNNIIGNKSGNNIHEVNLNYVNNFCCIW